MLCLARSMQHVIFPFLGSVHIGQHALCFKETEVNCKHL